MSNVSNFSNISNSSRPSNASPRLNGTRGSNDSGGRGSRGPGKIDPKDREQLAAHPVSVRRVGGLFWPHKWTILVVVLLISTSSIVSMAQPFLVRAIVDDALPSGDMRLLAYLAAGLVTVAAAGAVIGLFQTLLATKMGQAVMHGLRTKVYAHLQRQSMAFFTNTRGGEIQSRLTHDISGMQGVITSTATSVASQLTTTVATLVAMLALSPRLTAISLVVIPPAVLLSRRVALKRREITAARQRELAALHTRVEEGLSVSGVHLAKTLGTGQSSEDRFTDTSSRLVDLEVRSQLAGQWRWATMSIIFAAVPAVIYLASGGPIAAGTMSIGTLVAFTALQGNLFRPLTGLLNVGVQWVTSMALFSRIFEYLDLVPDVQESANPVAWDPRAARGDVAFEGVTFSYDKDEDEGEKVLQDVTFSIPAGRAIGLVGPTGSGKSTLASLLTRLYDPTSGRVTIDGTDVRDLSFADLAQTVGTVTQETYLVHASVRENLLIADEGASEEDMWEALEAAQIANLVRELPEGLDTIVGARGHRFSGGERQRLAIARTILRNPPILILDEATSALDNTTEAQVQKALEELSRGRTTLTIAHRLTTVENADQVVVLDRGRVAEQGTPEDLRREGGLFADLSLAA